MKRILIAAIVILLVAIGGLWYYASTVARDRDNLRAELTSVQATLADTQQQLAATETSLNTTRTDLSTRTTELADSQSQLSETKTDLASTQATLDVTQSSLNDTRQQLSDTQGELQNTKMDLLSAQASLNLVNEAKRQLQNTLDATQAQLTTATQTLQGLGITLLSAAQCTDVTLTVNASAKDPTWAELQAFLAKDRTEFHTYIANVYDCSQFSQALHNRAEAAGIRCAEVQVAFVGETVGHALNAFLTTDRGLVYVDDTEAPDKIARVVSLQTYRSVDLVGFNPANLHNTAWWNSLLDYYYVPDSYGGQAIVEFQLIYW